MKNSALKRIIAVVLCLVVFAGSELTGVTNIVGDLFAAEEEMEAEEQSDDTEEEEQPAEEPAEDVVEISLEDETLEEEIPEEPVTDASETEVPEEPAANVPENNGDAPVIDENVVTDTTESGDGTTETDGQKTEANGEGDIQQAPEDGTETGDVQAPEDEINPDDAQQPEEGKDAENLLPAEDETLENGQQTEDDIIKTEDTLEKPEDEMNADGLSTSEELKEGEEEPEAFEDTYEDGQVVIQVAAEPGVIPNGAQMSVKQVIQQDVDALDDEAEIAEAEELNAKYEDVKTELEATVAEDETKEIAGFLAYDINFLLTDEDGETTNVEPDGEVSVSMEFDQAYLPEEIVNRGDEVTIEDVDVLHMTEAEEGEETETGLKTEVVTDAEVSITENAVEKAEFVTDKSMTFVIRWTENDNGERIFTQEIGDATITVTAARGVLPDDALLKVMPILADNEETRPQYEDVEKRLLEKAEGEEYEIAGFLAYDISFTDVDGAKLEPTGEVKVEIAYNEAVIPEEVKAYTAKTIALDKEDSESSADVEEASETETIVENKEASEVESAAEVEIIGQQEETTTTEIKVMHLEEDEAGEVTGVVDMGAEEKVTELLNTERNEVQKAGFVTESFSTFVIIWTNATTGGELTKAIVTFWNMATGKELELENYPASVELKNGDTFNISDITETGARKDYYKLTDTAGREYVFVSANNTWDPDNPADNTQSPITGFRYQNGQLQWRHGSDSTWRNFQNEGPNKTDKFYFLYRIVPKGNPKPLETVETVDHGSNIIMRMIDHDGHKVVNGTHDYNNLPNGGQGGRGANELMGEQGIKDGNEVSPGLVEKTLTNGYPVLSNGGTNLSQLFGGGTTVNNLFIQKTFDDTGYYEYDSAKNYAYLDGNNFKVYDAVGTPYAGFSERKGYNVGNFFPYNDISDDWFSESVDSNGEYLHLTVPNANGNPDYFFGMYMEASFAQPEGGIVEHKKIKSDMVYEFTGDDDLWIFIDDVLVLDMGGIHWFASGSINFATGDIVVNGGEPAKIKDMYRAAGKFPDGSAWNEDQVSEYFNDNGTFVDYSAHTLKMFYMERGAGASNLHMKMNLPTVPADTVQVTKQLKDSDPKYANVEFPFQLFAQKADPKADGKYLDDYEPITGNATINVDENGDGKPDNLTFGENGIFKLKPGQTATFADLKRNRKYYVVEVGVDLDSYEDIIVNNVSYTGYGKDNPNTSIDGAATEVTGNIINLATTKQTVARRGAVVFTNDCSEKNSKPLFINKVMSDSSEPEEVFTVKIWMEGTESGKLEPYSGDYYLIKELGEENAKVKHYFQYESQEGKQVPVDKGQTAVPCGTTNDGIVMIPAGYTIETGKVIAETAYAVEELGLNSKLYETPDIVQITGDNATGETDASGNVKALGKTKFGDGATAQVTNKPITQYTWKIIKKGTESTTPNLEGAKFTLTSVTEEGETPVIYIGESQKGSGEITWSQETVDKDSGETISVQVKSEDILKGSYTLQEMQAPNGYAVSGEIWTIVLDNSGITITRPSKDQDGNDKTETVDGKKDDGKDGKPDEYTFTFYNTVLYELPATGGIGIHWYIVSGTLMMMLGLLILYKRKFAGEVLKG